MTRFTVDSQVGIRRVSLADLARLVCLLVRRGPLRYQDLANAAQAEKVLLTRKEDFVGKSTFYHYVSALKELGFAHKADSVYVPTGRAEELARVAFEDDTLGEKGREILRGAILSSDVIWRNFLVLFTGSRDSPLTQAKPVGLFPRGKREYVLRPFYDRQDIQLSESQTDAIMWGIRLWCIEAELMDEILVPTIVQIPPNEINIMYLVTKKKEDMTPDLFDELLRDSLRSLLPEGEHSSLVSIPLLLYHLCPRSQLTLTDTKEMLWQWAISNSDFVRAERGAVGVLQAGNVRRTAATRQKVLKSFLFVDGSYYTHLTVAARAIGVGP